MNSIKLHIGDELNDYKAPIQQSFDEIIPRIEKLIPLNKCRVQVVVDPKSVIPEIGIGGFTETPQNVIISVDLLNKNLTSNFKNGFKSTLAHELYHTVRNLKYPWPGTLLEDMVSEGLADHFDIEVNGGKAKSWSQACSSEEIEKLLEKAQPIFDTKEYGYYDWFFGSEEKYIPKWAGYSMGFKMVEEYMKKSRMKASELTLEDAKSFVNHG